MNNPISVIAFHDEGVWIAQCVEYDISVSAETLPKLRQAFEKAVLANICVNKKLGRSGLDGNPPAPSHFRDLFDNADTDLHPIQQAPSPAPVKISRFPACRSRMNGIKTIRDILERKRDNFAFSTNGLRD